MPRLVETIKPNQSKMLYGDEEHNENVKIRLNITKDDESNICNASCNNTSIKM
jgi:hypothetical protein